MTTLNASVSSRRLLISVPNWIGDSIMSMPAVQLLREREPTATIDLLLKPGLAALWKLHSPEDTPILVRSSLSGTWQTAQELRSHRYDAVYILTNSFRSALIPALAGIPERVGRTGHQRGALLTTRCPPCPSEWHQAWEYISILTPDYEGPLPHPVLRVTETADTWAAEQLAHLPRPVIALLPGAARGPSKRWPPDHFSQLAERITTTGRSVVLCGTREDQNFCDPVAATLAPRARSLAGRSNFEQWVALLHQSDAVVANDSGGMHVAAALGVPVLGIFGLTDPGKTAPVGPHTRIVQANSHIRCRDISRNSPQAIQALASIQPEQIYNELVELIAHSPQRR